VYSAGDGKMKEGNLPYLIRCPSCRVKNRIAPDKIETGPKCGKCHSPLNLTGIFSGEAVNVSEAAFDAEVFESPIPVMVLFWAPWCVVCRTVIPIVERIADKLRGRIKIVKVNIEQNHSLAARFQVLSVPLILLFDNGKIRETLLGGLTELEIFQKIARYI